MSDDLSIPPERLLEETRWLRALAERLVGPDSADDLAQTVWLRALRRPRAAVRQLRPWLRKVLHNAAIQRWREDEARGRREVAAASPEATLSTEALVERAALSQALVAAVLALSEPGRTIVLLRFFEGMSLTQIAQLQGIPDATVRSRLHRALQTLRARLDGEYGGRDRWTALALPLLGGMGGMVGVRAAAVGVLAMTTTTKATIGVAFGIVLLVGLAMWSAAPRAVAPNAPAVDGEQPAAVPVAAAAAAAESALPAAPASAPAASRSAVQSDLALVSVTVHGPDGAPIAGALVTVDANPAVALSNDEPHPLPRALAAGTEKDTGVTVPTGGDGTAIVSLNAAGMGAVSVSRVGWLTERVVEVCWRLGAVTAVTVDMVPTSSLRVEVVDPAGAPIADADVACVLTATEYLPADDPRHQLTDMRARTDASGAAVLAGLATGGYRVIVHADGWFGDQPPVRFNQPGEQLTLRIPLRIANTLVVTCAEVGSDRGIAGITVVSDYAGRKMSAGEPDDYISGGDGSVRVALPLGRATKLSFVSAAFDTPPPMDVPAAVQAVTIPVTRRQAIPCVVRDEHGAQVFEADIVYHDGCSAWTEHQTPADGVFRAMPRGPRGIAARFHHPTLGTSGWKLLKAADAAQGPIAVALRPPAIVRGQILTPGGAPCSARIQVVRNHSVPNRVFGNGGSFVDSETTTDDRGRFQFGVPGLGHFGRQGVGHYMVRVMGTAFAFDDVYVIVEADSPWPYDHLSPSTRIVHAPVDQDVDLGALRGAETAAVVVSVLRNGLPVPHAQVWLTAAKQSPHAPMDRCARADAHGVARFSGVMPGIYVPAAETPTIAWQPPFYFDSMFGGPVPTSFAVAAGETQCTTVTAR